MLIGFQGAGKSTFRAQQFPDTHAVVSKDLLRGAGVYWETFEKQGFNPKLGQAVTAVRRRLKVDRELALGEEYNRFVLGFLSGSPADDD